MSRRSSLCSHACVSFPAFSSHHSVSDRVHFLVSMLPCGARQRADMRACVAPQLEVRCPCLLSRRPGPVRAVIRPPARCPRRYPASLPKPPLSIPCRSSQCPGAQRHGLPLSWLSITKPPCSCESPSAYPLHRAAGTRRCAGGPWARQRLPRPLVSIHPPDRHSSRVGWHTSPCGDTVAATSAETGI